MSKATTVGLADPGKSAAVDNRRTHPRLQCSGFAEVVVAEAALLFRGSIRDLSFTGCYIVPLVRMTLRVGTETELRFLLEGEELTLPAQVKMTRPNGGIGFEFQEMSPLLKIRLGQMIKKLLLTAGK